MKPLCNKLQLRRTQQRIFIIVVFMELGEEERELGNRKKKMNECLQSLARMHLETFDGRTDLTRTATRRKKFQEVFKTES